MKAIPAHHQHHHRFLPTPSKLPHCPYHPSQAPALLWRSLLASSNNNCEAPLYDHGIIRPPLYDHGNCYTITAIAVRSLQSLYSHGNINVSPVIYFSVAIIFTFNYNNCITAIIYTVLYMYIQYCTAPYVLVWYTVGSTGQSVPTDHLSSLFSPLERGLTVYMEFLYKN